MGSVGKMQVNRLEQYKKIHLIRHGITEGNQKRWYYGALDLPLAVEGIEEIKELNKKSIYPMPVDGEFFTSGLRRTEETFELIYGEKAHSKLRCFREMEFGIFEGYSHKQLEDNQEYIEWIGDVKRERVAPGGESPVGFHKRVITGFVEFLEIDKPKSKEAVIICHGGVIAVIMDKYFHTEDKHFFQWIPNPARGYTVSLDGNKPVEYMDI